MDFQQIILNIAGALPGLLFAIIMHEYAHGRVAKMFGDDTAEREGRLSFNPAVHIDPFGTILFPLMGAIFNWAIIGWAKPVPVQTRNFKDVRKAIFWVSFAGPLSNFILGILSALIHAVCTLHLPLDFSFRAPFLQMLEYSVFINFLLGAFNIIPFPPLDGSRMLASFLKGRALQQYEALSRYAPMALFAIFGLSLLGIPTIHYLLMPFLRFGHALPNFFLAILN